MAERKLKILHTCPLGTGGITSMVLNICDRLDRDSINFDYLKYSRKKGFSEERAKALGGVIYSAYNDDAKNRFMKFWLKFYRCYTCCKEAKPDVLHINASTPYDTLIGISAKIAGVKKVVVHSHNANDSSKSRLMRVMQSICRHIMPLYTDAYFTCSTEAAQYMFPTRIIKNKQYRYIHNGIDIKRFRYNDSIRKTLREQYGLRDAIVIGNVGRFFKQKNHSFLIDIFYEIAQINGKAKLVLVGEGELQEAIKEKVNKLNIADRVVFWGPSDRVNELMQMFDVLLMPSLHEGLPVVGIEAQAAGLPCVFADTITQEVDITGHCYFLPLNKPVHEWANVVLDSASIDYDRGKCAEMVEDAGYSVVRTAQDLATQYRNIISK